MCVLKLWFSVFHYYWSLSLYILQLYSMKIDGFLKVQSMAKNVPKDGSRWVWDFWLWRHKLWLLIFEGSGLFCSFFYFPILCCGFGMYVLPLVMCYFYFGRGSGGVEAENIYLFELFCQVSLEGDSLGISNTLFEKIDFCLI